MTTDDLTRETFYSLLWRMMRDSTREGLCAVSGVNLGGGWVPWDQLATETRDKLRLHLLRQLAAHEQNRQSRLR